MRHGDGLLDPALFESRQNLIITMQAAYSNIADERKQNFAIWEAGRTHVGRRLEDRYRQAGWTAPPLVWDAFWKRVALPVQSRDPLAHVELLEALLTNYHDRVLEHCIERLSNNGNIHAAFCGPTGIGKSSCAIALADWLKPIPPERLLGHLFTNDTALPGILSSLTRGDTAIKDETPRLAGEGSITLRSMYENIEDTIRKSGINLFRLSPHPPSEEGTMQLVFEVFAWNPLKRASIALVWVKGRPHGVMALPWCPASLYAVYEPWKDANVESSLAGQFKDNAFLAKQAIALLEDRRFVAFMLEAVNKPKLKDFRSAIELFPGSMISGTQADRLASFMHDMCYNYERLGPVFEDWFGIKPNDGLEKVARKCYQE